ncbi:MAG: tripeptidase T [Candidatus Microgenomates bacterium]
MDELINLFTTICQIDSPTGEEQKMVDFVFNYLKKLNIFVKKDSFGNIYARIGNNPKVFLSAHLDTVEPGRGIKPKINKDYITSDGTTILGADNKVAVATILQATKEIIKENKNISFEIIFTLSEEIGNYGAINFDYKLLQSKIGFCFDSSNPLGTIITASPFYERFDLKIIGQEAHASLPDKAKNVLFPLFEILKKQKLGKIDRYTLFNIGKINAGYVRNTIPGELIINGEIRSFFEKNLIKIKNKFLKLLNEIEKKYQIKIEKSFVRENPGYFHNSKISQKIIVSLKKILKNLKLKPQEKIAWGVSDANIFNNKNLLVFNLADATEYTHSKKERIKIKDLLKLKEIIKNIIFFNF